MAAQADFSPCGRIMERVAQVIVGKSSQVELLLVALLSEGHVLLDDLPGSGKTILAKTLARAIGGSFRRIQFTPDLLPSDVTGFNIYDQKTGQFRFQTGPVMTNVLLADEVNRTIPRTQSSLLESMGEGQVTVDGETSILPRPFFVIATQNPIELEGTFPLPEAQMDRFLMRVSIGYPDHAEELRIMERFRGADPLLALQPVSEPAEIVRLQKARAEVRVSEPVREYIVRLVEETRRSSRLQFGASPRASLGLLKTAQALAAMRGRDYALPDDVKHLFAAVVEHRLILLPEERTRGIRPSEITSEILDRVAVPVCDPSL
ncbi:MAG: AAA family ATPase [Spirochaetes bacterium RBG_13_68_11]|nr:MAG: AAA family ATPase [Spirochaetes bacterium RBG_13_68_11]